MEGEDETNLTFLEDITFDDSPLENLEEGDPIIPSEDDIGDYFHIEKGKWEIVGPQFDCAPIYNMTRRMRMRMRLVFPFSQALFMMTYPFVLLGRGIFIFPCIKRGSWK